MGMSFRSFMYLSPMTAAKQETITLSTVMAIPNRGREAEDDDPPGAKLMYNDIVLIREVKRIHCKRVCFVPLRYIIIKAVTINFDWSKIWYTDPESPPMLNISSQS